jgi:large subunit ribosomal protein L9
MVTEVLLMTDVADLGSEGDVVDVAEGYARNYLFPRQLAAPVTEATRRRLAKIQKDREAALAAELEAAQSMARQLEAASCTIAVKTGEDEKLFGSVTAADIAASLKEQGIELDRHKIALDAPIKELGVFDILVKLHPQVDSSVKVWVVEE